MSEDLLPAVVVEPEVPATGSVVWLHGLGADGNDFVPVLPLLPLSRLGVRVVLPNAPSIPVTINAGMVMPAWYDIRFDIERHDANGVRTSAAQVEAWIAAEKAKGIQACRIALAGFSQGGAIALHVGLRHSERLAGIAALSTYLVLQDAIVAEASESNRETPIFQAHGSHDPVVAHGRGKTASGWLEERGYQVEWHDYPMQHEVCEPEMRDLGRWFESIFAGSA